MQLENEYSVGTQETPPDFEWFLDALFQLKFDFIEYGVNRNNLLNQQR